GRKEIGIERLHLEQDAGKSVHDQHPQKSLIDLNRSGVALMEIVSKPDMRSAGEAAAFFNKIRAIVRWIGSCDGMMAQGSMRADVNVSLHRPDTAFGTRAEIKNVNSIRFLRQAVEYEIVRQMQALEEGGEIIQETRLFDPTSDKTRSMRSKEDAHDYRYFPDPDLPPLEFDDAFVQQMRQSLPELPDDRRARFIADFGLNDYDATQLVADIETADYFEKTAQNSNSKLAANWVISELFGRLNQADLTLGDNRIAPEELAALINLIDDGTISGKMAKDVFNDMFETGETANAIIDKKGLRQISDSDVLGEMVAKLIADNPKQVETYRNGKTGLRGWFVGQIMKQTQGSANPQMVNELLDQHLDG
ncbi:MAG: Asp-tRNA(Asn)/Glu-tRNA(Gln) amidotransferase subunit GatB, partial [Pseudomonadota bacterium]